MQTDNVTRSLSGSFFKRTRIKPSDDIKQTLWIHYLKRLANAEDTYRTTGLEPQSAQLVYRAVGDTIDTLRGQELKREREVDAIDTWGTLKRNRNLIPSHRYSRSPRDLETLATIRAFSPVATSATEDLQAAS